MGCEVGEHVLPQICGRFVMFSSKKRASAVAQTVKNLPAVRETWV